MALRKPVSRCNNSSPRYTRENHYAILARMKVSQVFTYKISITLLIFQYVIDRLRLSNHKVNNNIPNPNYISPTKSSHCLQIITYSFPGGAESSGSWLKNAPLESLI